MCLFEFVGISLCILVRQFSCAHIHTVEATRRKINTNQLNGHIRNIDALYIHFILVDVTKGHGMSMTQDYVRFRIRFLFSAILFYYITELTRCFFYWLYCI